MTQLRHPGVEARSGTVAPRDKTSAWTGVKETIPLIKQGSKSPCNKALVAPKHYDLAIPKLDTLVTERVMVRAVITGSEYDRTQVKMRKHGEGMLMIDSRSK